jgi:hypothetical protein
MFLGRQTLAAAVAALTYISTPVASATHHQTPASSRSHHSSVVGTWVVDDPSAPFPVHMYVFNADGTLQQANPDAGDPRTSDSDGKGIWAAHGRAFRGKWVEILADRTTHRFVGRLELSFDLHVHGDKLTGSRSARAFDAVGNPSGGPFIGDFTGARVTLP